jgi:predicted DNA-binding transcriptional regulator AlpA
MVAALKDISGLPDWPRLLSREQAAAYCGISPTLFDALVKTGTLPGPIEWGARRLWDRKAVDQVLNRVSGIVGPGATDMINDLKTNSNPWNDVVS